VVLQSLDILGDDRGGNPQQDQKIGQDPMPLLDGESHRLTLFGQHHPAVTLVADKPLGIKTLGHVGDACLRNAETPGDVDHPGIPLGLDQFLNALQIIFHGGRGALGCFGGGHRGI